MKKKHLKYLKSILKDLDMQVLSISLDRRGSVHPCEIKMLFRYKILEAILLLEEVQRIKPEDA